MVRVRLVQVPRHAELPRPAVRVGLAVVWASPDCWAGKHRACSGDAWDEDTDAPTPCECPCHQDYAPDDWDPDEGPVVVDVPTGRYL